MLGLANSITAGGLPAFELTSLTSLKLWWKFNTITTPDADSDGDTDIYWTDSSGNNKNALQTTDAQEPNITNGYLAFTDDNVDKLTVVDSDYNAASLTVNACTIMMVLEDVDGDYDTTLGSSSVSNTWLRLQNNNTDFRWRRGGNSGGMNIENATFTTARPNGVPYLLTFINNSDNDIIAYMNGVQVFSQTDVVDPTNDFIINQFGTQDASATPFGGNLYECAVFNEALSDNDRAEAEQNIMDRVGIVFPQTILELDLWYDFSTTIAVHGSAFTDFSSYPELGNLGYAGSDYNLQGHTSGKKPTIDTSSMSLRSAHFDGSNDRFNLDNTYVTTGETFTVFYVIKKDDVSEADVTVVGTEGTPLNKISHGTNRAFTIQFNGEVDGDTDNAAENVFTVDSDLVSETGDGTEARVLDNNTHLYIFTKSAAEAFNVYDEAGHIASVTYGGGGAGDESTNLRIAHIGAESDSGAAYGGLIGEMGVFNKVLSDTERSGLINYIKAKWGI